MKQPLTIEKAEGKLGIMLVGLGAVSTTTIAGVLAIRRGLAKPIGSLTQMGTIRLGKRTEGNSPRIEDFVPLASLNDVVFGGWDIFEDNCYEAAKTAGVLDERPLLFDRGGRAREGRLVGVDEAGAPGEASLRGERREQFRIARADAEQPLSELHTGHRHGQRLLRRFAKQTHAITKSRNDRNTKLI